MTYPDNIIEIMRCGRPWAVRYMRFNRRWLRQLRGMGDVPPQATSRAEVRRTVRKYRALSNYRVTEGGE